MAAFAGCSSPGSAPQGLADSITRAVYTNDYDHTVSSFDNQTKAQITRSSLGDLSDRMHALGGYEGLSQTSADPDRGRYTYDARFTGGHLTVLMRLDPSGKVGAYRVLPGMPANPSVSASPAA